MTLDIKCDELQEKIKNLVLKDKDKDSNQQIITLRGFAGTGKTFTASKIISELKEKYPKKNIGAFAPTASAMSNLKSKLPDNLGITFNTLSSITQIPILKLTILSQTFVLNEDNIEKIYDLFDKLKISHSALEIKKEFSKDYKSGKVKEKIVLIPNIELIRSQLSQRFKKSMTKEVIEETDFEFLDVDSIATNLKPFDLIVIDEISMVSDEMMNVIEDALDFLKINDGYPQLLLCGDGGQLKQVKGNPNRFIITEPNDENIFELTKIYRSTDEISHLASFVRRKFPIKNLNVVRENTVIETTGNISELILQNKDILKNSDCVISFTNEVIDAVNTYIRTVKGYDISMGVKSNGEQWFVKKIYDYDYIKRLLFDVRDCYSTNDSVINSIDAILSSFDLEEPTHTLVLLENKLGVTKKAWIRYDLVDKKMPFFVRTISQDIDALFKLVDNPDEFPCYVPCTFAYAMTVHKAQGSEFDNVVYIVSDRDLRIANISKSATNLSYTAVTRAKKDLKIIYRTDIK